MTIIETIKEFKLLASIISMTIGFTITIYGTFNLYNSNLKQIELTQISLLKSQIRVMESNPCATSRDIWADYNMLYSEYYTLRKKHNPLLKELNFKPMERLTKDSCKCYKGGKCD